MAEVTRAGESQHSVDNEFWKEYKETYNIPTPTFRFEQQIPLTATSSADIVTAVGFLKHMINLGENLCFAHLNGGSGSEQVQIICRDPKLCDKLRSIRLNSAISVTGQLGVKHAPKKPSHKKEKQAEGCISLNQVEIRATALTCLNAFPADIHVSSDHVFPPQSRHLQIRYDSELRERLLFRSEVATYIRQKLHDFHEIETPILFKSTPEGAREFLVPTRKIGHAYALPQSPQQYKQILIASGIHRYFQFARCFRDEDLRADRQPEFTQIDLEMAFTDGVGVMMTVESLIKDLYKRFARTGTPVAAPLPTQPFIQMSYEQAMSDHGSDKPDLRIPGFIQRIETVVPNDLRGMLTSIDTPIIEAYKLRLNVDPTEVQSFVRRFMDSPEAEPFRENVDGAPGVSVYDSRKPVQGLQSFGFEGAAKLVDLYARSLPQGHKDYELNATFEDGDLLVIQAREELPFSGGSTLLGKLRIALYKSALAEGLVEPDPDHHYLWVTDFPMFTLDNTTDPGQGGTAGFSATHHPFTAPKTAHDVDLLLTDPLKAKADHYDLVVNGVELGGGSRRIHNAAMQQFVMREILKMSEERMNDFSHLFEALRAGCPPHAGLAVGFDRLMAVMTGRESVKDVIAFPKSSKGEDMMVKSPSRITDVELARYHLKLTRPVPPTKQNLDPAPAGNSVGVAAEPPSQA